MKRQPIVKNGFEFRAVKGGFDLYFQGSFVRFVPSLELGAELDSIQ